MITQNYPPGQITPSGARRLLERIEPIMGYRSPNEVINWDLMGPKAPTPGVQDGVAVKSIKGLIPPWQTRDQQGANQDGVTFGSSVYDPMVVDMDCEVTGRTPQSTQQVVRRWIESWTVEHQGELYFVNESGYWYAPIRWYKTPTNPLANVYGCRQPFGWTGRVDDGFWRSLDSVCEFRPSYQQAADDFERVNAANLGASWKQTYTGAGGLCTTADGHNAALADAGGSLRRVVNVRQGFTSDTDYQLVTEQHANFMEAPLGGSAFNDVWGRMGCNPDGSWDGNGIRARFGWNFVQIDRFVDFVGSTIGSTPTVYFNVAAPTVSLQCGTNDNPRQFIARVNGAVVGNYAETGTASKMGPDYRGAGFGMEAGTRNGGGQTTPSQVASWSAVDNPKVTQFGFNTLTNIGDQPGWISHVVHGPFDEVQISNGQGGPMVKFGPLYANQIALLRTEPRRRGVYDLTPAAANVPTQQLNDWQKFIKGIVSFATNNNIPPLLRQFESWFGIMPPQGEFYALLNGRFTKAIPPKPEGLPAVEGHITVGVTGGTADTKIESYVTPRRRYPL